MIIRKTMLTIYSIIFATSSMAEDITSTFRTDSTEPTYILWNVAKSSVATVCTDESSKAVLVESRREATKNFNKTKVLGGSCITINANYILVSSTIKNATVSGILTLHIH